MEAHPRDATYSVKLNKYTIESITHAAFLSGYQVGLVEGTYHKIFTQHMDFTESNVLRAVIETARETGSNFVGVWTDEKMNVHIDPCEYIHHRVNAVQMAEKNNQLSIWDWENMEEIVKADW